MTRLRVLLLEDSPIDAELLERELRSQGVDAKLTTAADADALHLALNQKWDVILSDFTLPSISAPEALKIVRENPSSVAVPFIVVSGTIGEEDAASLIRTGADDYLLKDRMGRLRDAIESALERRRLEYVSEQSVRALAESERKYRQLFDLSPIPLFVLDTEGLRILEANSAARMRFRYQPVDLSSMTSFDLRSSPDADRLRERLRSDPDGPASALSAEWTMVTKDGEEIPASVAATELEFGGRRVVMSVVWDLTEQRQAELKLGESLDALRRSDAARRSLMSHLVNAQESERRRIAEDIHDDSIQVMAAVALRLETLKARLTLPEDVDQLNTLLEVVHDSIGRLRRLLFELRPRSLDVEGLWAALSETLDVLEREEGIAGQLTGSLKQEPGEELRVVAFRITQEALTNVRKHSGASEVLVHVEDGSKGLNVAVRDNGHGFNRATAVESRPGHLGLSSMEERASDAGGWCKVLSQPGEGTTVEIFLPNFK